MDPHDGSTWLCKALLLLPPGTRTVIVTTTETKKDKDHYDKRRTDYVPLNTLILFFFKDSEEWAGVYKVLNRLGGGSPSVILKTVKKRLTLTFFYGYFLSKLYKRRRGWWPEQWWYISVLSRIWPGNERRNTIPKLTERILRLYADPSHQIDLGSRTWSIGLPALRLIYSQSSPVLSDRYFHSVVPPDTDRVPTPRLPCPRFLRKGRGSF